MLTRVAALRLRRRDEEGRDTAHKRPPARHTAQLSRELVPLPDRPGRHGKASCLQLTAASVEDCTAWRAGHSLWDVSPMLDQWFEGCGGLFTVQPVGERGDNPSLEPPAQMTTSRAAGAFPRCGRVYVFPTQPERRSLWPCRFVGASLPWGSPGR